MIDNQKRFLNIVSKTLKSNVKTIIEIGARDGEETKVFATKYPKAKVISFECNPNTIQKCRDVRDDQDNIILIEKAVSDRVEKVKFFPIDQEKTETTWKDGNPGASSLFKASGNYLAEKYVQNEITVDSTTLKKELDSLKINSVDMLWMDIQGSELNALKGLESNLADVKLIHTEVEFTEIYKNQPLFWDIKFFLNENNFYLIGFTSFVKKTSGDAVFVNKKIVKSPFRKLYYFFTNKLAYLYNHYIGILLIGK